jgi:hypothetical protein
MNLLLDAIQTTEEAPIVAKLNLVSTESPCTPNGLILTHNYHVSTGRLEYRVHWSKLLQDTVASYSDLQGLKCLTEYEHQMANYHKSFYGQHGYKKLQQKTRPTVTKYTLQRDKDAAALLDNMDSDDDELGQESKLTVEGLPLAPSIDSPQTSSGGWLRMLADTSSTLEDDYTPIKTEFPSSTIKEEVTSSALKMELPLDMAGTMMNKTSSMISSDWESNG